MMDPEEHNSCLANMPVLVVEKILDNMHNPSNVSRTCKYLYEIVCGMEKRRRVMYISAIDAKSPLNIDTDAVFASIMNSQRTIKEMELCVRRFADKVDPSYVLNERQMERMTAIMKQFGANVTSLYLHGFVRPINFIFKLLQQTPKLKLLSVNCRVVEGSITETATMSLQLPNLNQLDTIQFPGLLDIVNLIPAGSLNSICYIDKSGDSVEVLTTILAKQHNIKSLTLVYYSCSDGTALCFDHLQLDALVFMVCDFGSDIHLMDLLKCQTNLKELRFTNYYMTGSLFQWICKNLKKLEIFEVHNLDSMEGNAFEMLCELKELRHYRTSDTDMLFDNGFQSTHFKSDSIETLDFGCEFPFSCGERLTKVVNSIACSLPNLTYLRMKFENFSALCCVLGQCTKITHLTSNIMNPTPDELTQHIFPYIQYLELSKHYKNDEMLSQTMTSIVRAMPNLKSLSLPIRSGLKFDVETMKEFIRESKNLEYFYIEWFELNAELSTNDVVETIRCLTDQLKGHRIKFSASELPEDFNFHKIKDILSNQFYVRDKYWERPSFYLRKGQDRDRIFFI